MSTNSTTDDAALRTQEVIELIEGKVNELRKRLLDSTRRNPLINISFRPTSSSILLVVDELPDVLRYNLASGQAMRLKPLPALDEVLPDEQTDVFLHAFYFARNEDKAFLNEIAAIKPSARDAEDKALNAERALKDRLREALELPQRQTTDSLSLSAHAKNYGISSSYALPLPEDENVDGRHQDEDIQTLMLPEKLIRTAKSILEKGKGFERETGVNVLHAAFGILEWKNPDEREKYASPLLLLEIQIERKQSPRGAEFFISGIEKISVNTTLAQKLHSEHHLEMPEYTVGNIEDYFHEVQNIAPPGWEWAVRREVAIGIFPSSKIAMYHDLNPKKRNLALNPIVARLLATTGVGDGSYAEVYETDAPEIAKKVPHLVMDADASQYSALVDVADGKSLAIEGPPGSGKSQSIVNLIAAAMAEGKKVLFVAEKLTALDVVKNRLAAANLGAFILPLQAGKSTAEKVYDSLEARLKLGRGSSSSLDDFESRQIALERRRAILQTYLNALESQFGSTGMTVFDVIGHGIATGDIRDELPRDVKRIRIAGSETLSPTMIESLISDAEGFAQKLGKINRMPKLWIEAQALIQTRDDAEDVCNLISTLTEEMTTFDRDLRSGSLLPHLSKDVFSVDFGAVTDFLEKIAAHAGRVDAALVEKLIDPAVRRTVRDFCGQIQERQGCRARLARHLADINGWNLHERFAAARAFAEQNGGILAPEQHEIKIRDLTTSLEIAERVYAIAQVLPGGWTGNSLAQRQSQAQELFSFPAYCLGLRVADPDGQAGHLDLPRFRSGQVFMLSGLSFEGHGAFPAQC